MADDKDLKLDEKGKGNKKIIIIAVILILALGGGGAAFFLLSDDDSVVEDSAGVVTQIVDKKSDQIAYYVALPRPFVFNVIGLKRERLVQIKVQLMVRGSNNQELAKANLPLIESTLLQVFSATTEQQLATYQGKELVRTDSLTSVNEILTKYTGVAAIEKILFSGFVMQ